MEEKNKGFIPTNQLIYSIIELIIGIVLLILDGPTLVNIFFVLVGVLIIIFNIELFIQSIKDLKYKTKVAYTNFIKALIPMIFSILLICFQNHIGFIIGILLLALAIYNIYQRKDKLPLGDNIIKELPLLIISIILLTIGIGGILEILITIIAIILIVSSVVSIIYYLKNNKN